MYDSIIIGSGPAGISAALNLNIFKKNFLWFGKKNLSDKIYKAEKINNYPGFPSISGIELQAEFAKHIAEAGLEITEQTVTKIMSMGDYYMVLADNDVYETRTIILATGVVNVDTLDGEEALIGRGVSYCATCDGMLYRDRKIAVISNDNRYDHEIKYLSQIAKKIIYYPSGIGCDFSLDNIKLEEKKPVSVKPLDEQLLIGLSDGTTEVVDGLFCLRNAIAMDMLLPGINMIDNHIDTDRDMNTSFAGIFAAGDCTGRPYQYAKAIGEGNIAAHSCVKYLSTGDN